MDSPAIDQIPPASCTYPTGSLNPCSDSTSDKLTCDQRGFPRPGDPSSGNCDIGAFELEKCPGARASAPILWPANDKFDYESVLGVYDVRITAIDQDEPVDRGASCPDADVVGGSLAQLRAERDATGDGRVYQLEFTAIDALTKRTCSGEVEVCVPRDAAHRTCGDEGAIYDSTKCGFCGPGRERCLR